MRIALLGDTALYGRYSTQNRDIYRYFSEVAAYLAGFDHVVANLETPFVLSARPRGAKSAYIASHPDNVEILKLLGVGAVNLANNHIFDYGQHGLRQTKATLRSAGIGYFGVDGAELDLDSQASHVSLLGYCSYNTNPLGMRRGSRGYVNAFEVSAVRERLGELTRAGRYPVISVHSGVEHVHFPGPQEIAAARHLAETAPFVYYGHHPHVIQGYERHRDALLAYSLGNFCFDDVYTDKAPEPVIRQGSQNKTGLILELEIVDARLVSYAFTPTFLGLDRMELGSADTLGFVDELSKALAEECDAYAYRRNRLIRDVAQEWKKKRDFAWYVNRLNPKTVRLVVDRVINRSRHQKAMRY